RREHVAHRARDSRRCDSIDRCHEDVLSNDDVLKICDERLHPNRCRPRASGPSKQLGQTIAAATCDHQRLARLTKANTRRWPAFGRPSSDTAAPSATYVISQVLALAATSTGWSPSRHRSSPAWGWTGQGSFRSTPVGR